jgi:multicomponent Na+:H+ antiporter subunit E
METLDDEGQLLLLVPRLLIYAPWLVKEIVLANIDVARRILHPRMPISPSLVKVKCSQRLELARVIYANSITLTPGTVSVDMEGDTITVHALSRNAAEGVLSGEMDRKVTRLIEGRG